MKNHIANVFSLWRKSSVDSGMTRRNGAERGRRRSRASLEILETRQLLATIAWNTTAAPNGGDWDTPGNWVQNKVPGPNDTAKISGLTSPGIVSLNSGAADSVLSVTTDSSTTLEVITGSLSIGAGLFLNLRRAGNGGVGCRTYRWRRQQPSNLQPVRRSLTTEP